MKKNNGNRFLIISFLITIIMSSVFIVPASTEVYADASFSGTAYINSKEGAYLRQGAGTNTKKLALLKHNTKVKVYSVVFTTNSNASSKRWFQVSVSNKTGYVRADLIKGLRHDVTKVAWAKDTINIRATPGLKSSVIGTYKKNAAFYVVMKAYAFGSKSTWYKVYNNNSFYYVCGDYITFKKPSGGASKVTTSTPVKKAPTEKALSVKQSAASRKVAEGAVKWAVIIANDNSFHYGNGAHAHHNGCYFCGTQPYAKRRYVVNWQKSYCCNPFVHAAYAHGGNEPTMLKKCRNYGSYDWNSYKRSKLFAKLGHPAKSALIKGDVLCYDGHVAMYIGNGKYVEASGGDDGRPGSRKWNNSISVKTLTDRRYSWFPQVYRYIGKN